MVFGSYRKDDFADPDSYRVQLGMVLERYPDAIITESTNPVSGIQRTCKFPPSIAEVVEFCDSMQRRANAPQNWEEQSRKQLAERVEFQIAGKSESTGYRKGVVDRMRQEMAAAKMPIMGDAPLKAVCDADVMKKQYKVSDAEWNAIPNLREEAWKQPSKQETTK